ncbi:hypothetical protein FISHEDRAFT_75399 [Fistulina hepatica ATCC 64428]|uniref:F-box domain-containing protein n=1 Tax=Fistulina hepatica ATCC 64428 TaxID=1128425 RepID=A0A0D7A7G3_9AGAR|nr:hypothetical protein FISHEDRAFT_75399 [Fistulina hepatica ATCC 64428]
MAPSFEEWPELFTELEMLRGLVAPIRRLPNELLVEIFLHRTVRPLFLAAVCHRWRAVVLNAPRLWSTLDSEVLSSPEMIACYMQLSKSLDLTVKLDGGLLDVEDDIDLSLQTLRQCESRIKRLVIINRFELDWEDPPVPDLLERNSFTFPMLESLYFNVVETGTLTTTLFSNSPHLKWVYLDEIFRDGIDVVPKDVTFTCQWEGIETLCHEAQDMAHAWRVLARCASSLRLYQLLLARDESVFTPAPLDLPCLEVLRLGYNNGDAAPSSLFSQLSCPRLHELCIDFEGPAFFNPHLFMDFVARSPAIKTLDIQVVNQASEDDGEDVEDNLEISDYFAQPRLFDNVRDLTLRSILVFSGREGSKLWRNMISCATSGVSSIPLFPALRKLSIDGGILRDLERADADRQICDLRGDFVQLVELRCKSFTPAGNVVRLEELNMPGRWQSFFNREHIERLETPFHDFI